MKKIILLLSSILIGITLVLNFRSENTYPTYINEFVKKNPQAKELKTNYQVKENHQPINISYNENIPLLMQWDKQWAYTKYGEEIIGTAGCGPTCLSMVAIELTKNTKYNPQYIAKYAINHDYLEGSKTKWSLMETGCKAFGIKATAIPLYKAILIKQLKRNKSIICSVGPGDFTTTEHFIVITKFINNQFYIHDPNSKENSKRPWPYERLAKQIKALWVYSKL